MNASILRLARAYFHQDYPDEADQPIELVEVFRDNEPVESVNALRGAFAAWLGSDATEDELSRRWLDDADSSYDPAGDDLTMRQWLQQVVDVLDHKTDAPASEVDAGTATSVVVSDPGTEMEAPTSASPPAAEGVRPPSNPSPGIPFKGTTEP